ncbi:MAG: hypothetical protein HRT47_06205 [Candidatus Caenarcaniphilales bacterium]|nr:hypothetical protein [Candidatus Caenarcaniphilales bacterium]
MAINVRFQNLSYANHEILKTFNSASAEKALEAYQPLTEKQRKLRKLSALQLLKKSSNSGSLSDISLDDSSLAAALKSADGATLQAMLNLLSAKMIEQNKLLITKKTEEVKAKEEEERKAKLEAEKKAWEEEQARLAEEEAEEEEEDKTLIEELIENVVNKFEDLKKYTLEAYQNTLDFFTLKRLKQFYDDAIEFMKDFLYRQPLEYLQNELIEPILEIPNKIQNHIETNVKESIDKYKRMRIPTSLNFISPTIFSQKELKFVLEKSISGTNLDIRKQVRAKKQAEAKKILDVANKLKKKKFVSKDQAIASLHK